MKLTVWVVVGGAFILAGIISGNTGEAEMVTLFTDEEAAAKASAGP